MKKIMYIMMVLGLISFSACTKDSSDNNNVIRFDFSSTRAGDFSIEGKAGSDNFTASLLNADNWSKTITVTKSYSVADSAAFTVYPPVNWIGTTFEADVVLKIFVNNVQKATASGYLTGIDRPTGVTISTTY